MGLGGKERDISLKVETRLGEGDGHGHGIRILKMDIAGRSGKNCPLLAEMQKQSTAEWSA